MYGDGSQERKGEGHEEEGLGHANQFRICAESLEQTRQICSVFGNWLIAQEAAAKGRVDSRYREKSNNSHNNDVSSLPAFQVIFRSFTLGTPLLFCFQNG
jgi:hypothetical protein